MSSSIDRWLAEHGLEALSSTMRANDIDLDILGQLSDSELSELGISIGNRKRILKALAAKSGDSPSTPAPAASLSERRQVVDSEDQMGMEKLAKIFVSASARVSSRASD